MTKIGLKEIKNMINEELEKLKEGDDHKTGAKVMKAAADLLTAIDNFKKNSSAKAKADLEPHLDAATKLLKRVADSPMQYVDATQQPKRVTLKPKKENLV